MSERLHRIGPAGFCLGCYPAYVTHCPHQHDVLARIAELEKQIAALRKEIGA